jgi:ribosomal protein L29|uniref:Large ribosomal subunit protein uL29 n=1 Tax=candidate division CPR3 bacterium TaxID=2268181 RepID=A0A7C5UUE3_UNCC3
MVAKTSDKIDHQKEIVKLEKKLKKARIRLSKYRQSVLMGKEKNFAKVRFLRKEVARILTKIGQIRLLKEKGS